MNTYPLKSLIIAILITTAPIEIQAKAPENFQPLCVEAWMKKINKSANTVDYKNFGEKYCACVETQALDTEVALKKAVQLCISRTLLHDAMDSLEDEVGLNEAKETDLTTYCMAKWTLIYPKQDEADKQFTMSYCTCAKPKLVDLLKKSDNMTDKEYSQGIDSIAADCSGNVKEETSVLQPIKK